MSEHDTWLQAHVTSPSMPPLGWSDYVGGQAASRAAKAIVSGLSARAEMQRHDLELPHGLLLHGPSGCGKTHLARIIAAVLTGAVFYEFDSGEFTVERMRALADRLLLDRRPTVVFIDEIDFWGRSRWSDGMNEARRAVLFAALSLLDGFRRLDHVFWIAASNSPPAELDEALLRAGRLGLRVEVSTPSRDDRIALFTYFLRSVSVAPDVSASALADDVGMAGTPALIRQAIISAYLTTAATGGGPLAAASLLTALRAGGDLADHDLDGEGSVGDGRQDQYRTAVHEAGHAVVSVALGIPPSRIEIKNRETTRGLNEFETVSTSERMRGSVRRAFIATLLGGMLAERMVLSEPAIGAESDLRSVSLIGAGLAPAGVTTAQHELTRELGMGKSPWGVNAPAAAHDGWVGLLSVVHEQTRRANDLLWRHRFDLERLAAELLERHTMSEVAVLAMIGHLAPNKEFGRV